MPQDPNAILKQLQTVVSSASSVEPEAYAQAVGLPRALSDPLSDPMGFVLQIAALLFGVDFIETKLNGLLRELTGTADQPGELEATMKKALYRMCVEGLGDRPIPPGLTAPGYSIPVRLLDLFELFRIEPASEEGRVAHSKFEKAIIENVLRRPGIAYRVPEYPYLSFASDAAGQMVRITFDPTNGRQPAPTRLVDLFGDIIFDVDFRLFDPTRIAMDVLDVVLGITGRKRSLKALEREAWLNQVVSTLSAETTSEELFDFSAPALAQVRATVAQQREGYALESGCEPESRQIPASAVVVPTVPGSREPNLELAYQQLISSHLVTSGSPGAGAETPVRDKVSTGLAKALVLVLARNTVLAPRVWTLLMLSRLLRGKVGTGEYERYVASGVNEVDFKGLVTGVRPLLEEAVKVVVRTGVKYLSVKVLAQLRKLLRPLLQRVLKEQASSYIAVVESLLPFAVDAGTNALTSALT